MNDISLKKKATEFFLKYGDEGKFTKLFDNLRSDQKQFWEDKFAHGLPIITCYKSENHWVIITTKEIVYQHFGNHKILKLNKIENVRVNLQRFLNLNGKPGKIDILDLETKEGVFVLFVESGASHIGLMYVINLLTI